MFSSACRRNFAARSFAINNQKRNSGGFLKKNSHVEENSGLREISYWTWGFSETSMSRFLAYTVIPSVLFYTLVEIEFEEKNKQIGRKGMQYGIFPPGPKAE